MLELRRYDQLDNYLRKKLNDLLNRLSKKKISDLINKLAKFHKLKKALKHRPNKDALDAIKKAAIMDLIKEYLLNIIKKKDDKLRKLILKYYLQKWLKKVKDYNDRENIAADYINKVTKGYLMRKYFYLNEKMIYC